jgi:hypothetical protein
MSKLPLKIVLVVLMTILLIDTICCHCRCQKRREGLTASDFDNRGLNLTSGGHESTDLAEMQAGVQDVELDRGKVGQIFIDMEHEPEPEDEESAEDLMAQADSLLSAVEDTLAEDEIFIIYEKKNLKGSKEQMELNTAYPIMRQTPGKRDWHNQSLTAPLGHNLVIMTSDPTSETGNLEYHFLDTEQILHMEKYLLHFDILSPFNANINSYIDVEIQILGLKEFNKLKRKVLKGRDVESDRCVENARMLGESNESIRKQCGLF